MKFTLKRHKDQERGWPAYLLGGHVRTSTLVLLVAFLAVWWVYDNYKPPHEPVQAPAPQVVPPGFVPDPSYTWVPRTQVRQQPPATPKTTAPSEPTTTTTPTTTEPPARPPLFPFPLPPPFGPPPSESTPPESTLPAPDTPAPSTTGPVPPPPITTPPR